MDPAILDCDYDSDNTSSSEDIHDESDYQGCTYDQRKLKRMRKKVNWENDEDREQFCNQFDDLIENWEGEYPNLRDIFSPEEVDWLLTEDVKKFGWNMYESIGTAGIPLIDFFIKSGYKDEPKLDEDGKPVLRRTTAVHYAHMNIIYRPVISRLFKIYDRFDVNYADEDGYTHFHVACKLSCDGVVAQFLVLGQDPDYIWTETGESPLHLSLDYCNYFDRKKVVELLLKSGANPNLANIEGSTPLHRICELDDNDDLLKFFFKICDDQQLKVRVDARDKSGNTPLHLALSEGHKKIAESLLRRGTNPNLVNEEGDTPLHMTCKGEGDDDRAELFFKINDEIQQTVQIDAKDKLGRTPLQWAVANLLPNTVDLLLNRGADLSDFIFPTEDYFLQIFAYLEMDFYLEFKIKVVSTALDIVERLEKRGYKLNRAGALTIMKTFASYGLFNSERLDTSWSDKEWFAKDAKEIMMNPELSLYDLIQLQPKEAEKVISYADFTRFVENLGFNSFKPEMYTHLCEMITRGFCRRWALESFVEVTRDKFPISWCKKIIDPMMNKDLYFICLKASE